MNKLTLFAALATLTMSLNAFAGATNIILDCKSASGRTTLKGGVPGDFAEFEVNFAIDQQEKSYFSKTEQVEPYKTVENSSIQVLGQMRKQNFKFFVWALNSGKFDFRLLAFEAIPGSIHIKKTPNGERGSLRANIQGIDPRSGESMTESKKIELTCNYIYEI